MLFIVIFLQHSNYNHHPFNLNFIKMKKFVAVIAALFATMGAAQAQMAPVEASPLRFMAGLGASFGGDNLATAVYTNGNKQDIKAGSGVYFTAGTNYRVNPAFSLQASINFHVDDTHANNGNIKFQRFPIELLAYYHFNEQFRLGGGVRYVSSAKLSSGGVAAGLDVEFDNTTSGVVEGEYFFTPQIGMKLRYVKESFKAARVRGDIKADHVGISANYYF